MRRNCRSSSTACTKQSQANQGGELPKSLSPKDFKGEGDGITKGRIVTSLQFADALVPSGFSTFIRGLLPHSSPDHSPSTTLANAFAEAYIYFNHFTKVHDLDMLNREHLWRLICRGAAAVCTHNQRGFDIVIPVLMGQVLRPQFVTAIFIQVKNDSCFTDDPYIPLFALIDPFQSGFFSEDDAKVTLTLPPILRIVLALASEKSIVTGPIRPRSASHRDDVKDKFTAYDLWIAGVSRESFGVIPDEYTSKQYRLLLDRTLSVFNYG